jgi:hypothetical protein
VRPERDLGGRADLAEDAARVVGEHRVGLGQKRLERLGRAAAHEVDEALHEVRLLVVHPGGEAEREHALDDGVCDRGQPLRQRSPHLDQGAQVGVGAMPPAVHRERAHPLGVARRQVQADCPAQRDAGHVRALDARGGHERGHLVGVALGRVGAGRLCALARARQVDRDAAEVLGVGRQLERVAGVVGAGVGDEQERLPVALHVVVDAKPGCVDLRHGGPPAVSGR